MNAAAHSHSIKPNHNIGFHIMQTLAWFGISATGIGVPIILAVIAIVLGG